MNIYTALTIGEHHVNFCEDNLLNVKIGENFYLIGVFDGCSMGNESHFAATLTTKILKKVAIEMDFMVFKAKQGIENLLKQAIKRLFEELITIQNLLLLSKYDLLNTLLIGVLDAQTNTAKFLAIGDGVLIADDKTFVFNQNNQPDYMGYHLHEDFESWFSLQRQFVILENWKDITISTDGIFTFKNFDNKNYSKSIEVIQYLCEDKQFLENENMLNKKMHLLATQYGLKPTDDVAIIRVIRDSKM